MFLRILTAHEIHTPRHASREVNSNKANDHCYNFACGFDVLGCSVTHIVLSMGHFLYRFSTFLRKNVENLSSIFKFFAKRSIEFRSFDLIRLAVRLFQLPL